jgi:hypothetical protein
MMIDDPFPSTVEPRPARVLIDPHSAWATIPQSQWISSQPNSGQGTNGTYFYKTCFCLRDGFSRPSLQLSLRADDQADVFLNKTLAQIKSSTPPAPILQGAASSFSSSLLPDQLNPPYTGPFQIGENCLIVRVRNTGGVVTGLDLTGSITAAGPNGAGGGVVTAECCRRTGSVCGMKWNDLNNDGIHQSSEPGLQGWTIQLSNGQTAVTDQFGNYCFSELTPGGYTLKEINQTGWAQTLPKASGSYSVTVGAATATGGFEFGNCKGPACGNADFTFTPACAGDAVQFTNTSTGATTFAWSFTNGNPATSTAANPSASFPAGSHPVKLCINGGTAPPLCVTKAVTIKPKPAAPVINGPVTSCNAPATYCVSPVDPSLTYNWSVSSPHTITGSSTGSCAQVTWSPPGQGGVVTVTATNKAGCSSLSRMEVKPCVTSLAECCQCNELSVKNEALSGSTFTASVTATPMPMTRVSVDLISTTVTPFGFSCGTAGPRDSSINVAGSSLPPLANVIQPVTPGREITFGTNTPAPLVNAPLTLNLQLPPAATPRPWCGHLLSFCLKYSFTGRDCKSCELIECYGPYRRGGLIIDDVFDNVVLNQRFNLQVKALSGDEMSSPASNAKALLRLKPGTGAPGAQLLGRTQADLVGGTATFSGLAIDKPGEGYVLELLVGDGNEAVAESRPFSVRQDVR